MQDPVKLKNDILNQISELGRRREISKDEMLQLKTQEEFTGFLSELLEQAL